jgi:hypothetical protein
MSLKTLAALLAAFAAGCSVTNESHCGNQSGDVSCAARDPERPFCSLCEASNDGCVAEPVTVEACHRESDSGPPATVTDGSTTATASTSTTPTTSTGPTTGTTEQPDTSTGTTTTTATSTSSSTTDETTTTTTLETTTTDSSSTTLDTSTTEVGTSADTTDSTTMVGPVCGNNVAEAGELCDGTDLKGKGCVDYPALYGGGDLACSANCKAYDFAGCCKLTGVNCTAASQCCSEQCPLLVGKCN